MQNHHQNLNNNPNNPLQLESEQVKEKQAELTPTGRVFNIGGFEIAEYMPEGFKLCPYCTCCTSTDVCGNCGAYLP